MAAPRYHLSMAEDNEFSVFPRCWSSIASKNSEQLTRVVTYNVLTDLAIPEGSYNYVPENCRYMKTRHKCIMKEITQFAADIIAFQEVDSNHFDSWLKKDMEALGYFGEHSKRLDDCGMATFYKQNRFNVFKRKDCILHALAETHLQRSGLNQNTLKLIRKSIQFPHEVLILGLHDKLTGQDFYIGNIHCIWAELKYPALQALQAACAVQEIYDLIGRADMPLIICGDFNAPNDHPTYKMFSNGRLEISPLKKQISFSAEEFNVDEILSEALFHLLPSDAFCIPTPLTSAYKTVLGKEPEITNCDAACQPYKCRLCLDYLWYDQKYLSAVSVLETPPSEDIERHYALPSVLFPSDHLPLVADFAYLKHDCAYSKI